MRHNSLSPKAETHFTLHHIHRIYVDCCYRMACHGYVCVLDATVNSAKSAEEMEMPFGAHLQGPKNLILDWDPHPATDRSPLGQ